ncbi:HNH endonuclease family protein [Allocatelliglobosispora scoriae]
MVAALIMLAALAAGCDGTTLPDASSPSAKKTGNAAPPKSGSAASAKTALAKLNVASAEAMTGYTREKFPHWRSAGSNCDVRDTVLERDGKAIKKTGCNVTGGTWSSWYDGLTTSEPLKIDIDHMVPLANAWRSGANAWTTEQRGDFANDLTRPQLFAVSAASNRSKGDQAPDTWKPPSKDAWCTYAQDWITVKTFYKLNITAPEKAALSDMLGTCA